MLFNYHLNLCHFVDQWHGYVAFWSQVSSLYCILFKQMSHCVLYLINKMQHKNQIMSTTSLIWCWKISEYDANVYDCPLIMTHKNPHNCTDFCIILSVLIFFKRTLGKPSATDWVIIICLREYLIHNRHCVWND